MTVLAAILVGGESRRMGDDKALVSVAGKPMLSHVAAAALQVTDLVVTVGRSERLLELPAVQDPDTRTQGPLAGLVAALDFGHPDHVLLLAVDQPWVRPQTLHKLVAERGDVAIVPIDGNVRQVTCSVYPSALLAAAQAELDVDGSVQSLLDKQPFQEAAEAEWRAWGEDGRSWFSVDDAAALEVGLRQFGAPGG